jgi:hypothetical protein
MGSGDCRFRLEMCSRKLAGPLKVVPGEDSHPLRMAGTCPIFEMLHVYAAVKPEACAGAWTPMALRPPSARTAVAVAAYLPKDVVI